MSAIWILLGALTPVAPELLQELEDAAVHFKDATEVYEADIQTSIIGHYQSRRRSILRAYEDHIEALEVEERSKRSNAIAAFEAFLKKHPRDPTYTPDAMFRLAELYFERSNDDYFVAMRAFEKDDRLPQPRQSYPASIKLYEQLIAEFTDYRLLDGAYYLLGYCLGEQGEEERGTEIFLQLVERFPKSRFVVETWTRLGEYYFDGNKLEQAIAAYQHVLDYKDSAFFDKALYKLGWSYYRLDRFEEAILRFSALVDFSDERKKAGGAGGELRAEALQYLGISFADEHWGSLKKLEAFFAKTPRAWANELYAQLGNVYFEQSKYPDAIAAYELALKAKPLDREAPRVRDKEITAYERIRDFDGAAGARTSLANDYAEGTPWHQENANDSEALAVARELSERSLLAAAVFHHRQAQSFKEQGKASDATRHYAEAAKSYERYLARFPGAKNRYELTYYLADCQYYAQLFGEAAASYGLVADDDSSTQYLEVAAYAAVLAAEQNTAALEGKGLLPARPAITSAQRKEPPSAVELPPPRRGLVTACDRYAVRVPPSDKTPAVLFKGAETLYAHDRFDEARERFMEIIDAFPESDAARFSANLVIESFLAEQSWDAVERFSVELAKAGKVGKGDEKFQAELVKFKHGAMFKKAEALESAHSYEGAAVAYLRLVDDSPRSDFADKALNNAAVNYEKARRFESATKLYERLSHDYPTSSLADDALFRVGVNSERFYDFEAAISAYLRIVENYPQSPQRADALFNAANALENTQQYDRAIAEYRRYATLFPDRKDAADIFFRAGRAAETAGDRARAVAIYEEFIGRYKAKAKASDDRLVEAYLRKGVLAKEPLSAKKDFTMAVKEAAARRAGVAYAAEAQFRIAEQTFAEYDAIVIDGSSKQQKAAIVKRATTLQKVREAFSAVFPFKQVEWTLAALYRLGHLYETFADKLFTAPAPPEIKKLGPEYVEEYRALIEQQATPLEDKAVDAYKRALAEAKKSGVANVWTKRTQLSLNKLRKNEFPLQKEARQSIETLGFSAEPLIRPPPSSAPVP